MHKRFQYDKVRTLIGPFSQVVYRDLLPELDIVMHDHDLLLNNSIEGEVNLILEDDTMDQATSKGSNGEEFTLS